LVEALARRYDRGAMARVTGFPPIARRDARVLILGSMPGAASLQAQQYYAHPRNALWKILGALLDFDASLPYPARKQRLLEARIALWDVLQSCRRAGSLDADIERTSRVPNDFVAFFHRHPHLTRVYFNGAAAEQVYGTLVLPTLDGVHLTYARLPSTSPAHAAHGYADKLRAWRVVMVAA
jgi:double-stranded uracil-DNA glycosylase